MKKIALLLVLFALFLCSCGSSNDVSSVLEVSSVQEDSSEMSSIPVPEDEPYVELTPLTDEEIANLKLPEEYTSTIYYDGFFTKQLIAISFTKGAAKSNEPLYILISRDGGATWEEQVFNDNCYYQNFITFSSEKNGCLVIQSDYWLGGQGDSLIYITHDGGKSWREVTSTNTVCTWRISDALFISRNIGFVCHFSHPDTHPVFCRTVDGGISWEKVVLHTDDINSGKASYGNIASAEYKDGAVIFNVRFYNTDGDYYEKFVSRDLGQTFEKAE